MVLDSALLSAVTVIAFCPKMDYAVTICTYLNLPKIRAFGASYRYVDRNEDSLVR